MFENNCFVFVAVCLRWMQDQIRQNILCIFLLVRRFFFKSKQNYTLAQLLLNECTDAFSQKPYKLTMKMPWEMRNGWPSSIICYRRAHREFSFVFSNHIFEFYQSLHSKPNFCQFKRTIMSTHLQSASCI